MGSLPQLKNFPQIKPYNFEDYLSMSVEEYTNMCAMNLQYGMGQDVCEDMEYMKQNDVPLFYMTRARLSGGVKHPPDYRASRWHILLYYDPEKHTENERTNTSIPRTHTQSTGTSSRDSANTVIHAVV